GGLSDDGVHVGQVESAESAADVAAGAVVVQDGLHDGRGGKQAGVVFARSGGVAVFRAALHAVAAGVIELNRAQELRKAQLPILWIVVAGVRAAVLRIDEHAGLEAVFRSFRIGRAVNPRRVVQLN